MSWLLVALLSVRVAVNLAPGTTVLGMLKLTMPAEASEASETTPRRVFWKSMLELGGFLFMFCRSCGCLQ